MARRDEDDPQPRFQLVKLHEIEVGDDTLWVIRELVPQTGVTVVYGPSGVGKTFLVLDLVMHVALGIPFRGLRVEQGAVIYLAAESQRGFQRRCVAFRQEKVPAGQRPPFYAITAALSLIEDHQELVQSIRDGLAGEKPAIVVIDTLNKTLRGSEMRDDDMGAYYQAAEAVYRALGCAVIVVHHTGWDTSHMRGHSSLKGNVEASLAVQRDAAKNVVIKVEKQREGEDDIKFVSRLRKVEIGMDRNGEPITSCVVDPSDGPPARRSDERKPQPTRLSGDVGVAYTELRRLEPPVLLEEWRAALGCAFASKTPGARRQAISHVRNTLEREGLILVDGDTVSVRNAQI